MKTVITCAGFYGSITERPPEFGSKAFLSDQTKALQALTNCTGKEWRLQPISSIWLSSEILVIVVDSVLSNMEM